jgi:murein DD-endopeptidase MepM/ murein hydrolase activator NlpD
MEETSLGQDLGAFGKAIIRYFKAKVIRGFGLLEAFKSKIAARLYWQRGRFARPFIHSGMAILVLTGITFGPTIISETFPGLTSDSWQEALPPSAVLSAATTSEIETETLTSIKPRAEVIEYTVKSGDTISTIADTFGVSIDTIRWANDLKSVKDIKMGQTIKILPVTGITHKVQPGDTIYSIAKKYDTSAQGIVDWPYNSFANDETFELAVGQVLVVPDGVMPKEQPTAPRPTYFAQVPPAGSVTGTGQFVWPTGGRITQAFRWYHKGIDIANADAPPILAADSGTVMITGWPDPWAYGNRILIDHGNGFSTLYAHLSAIYVSPGQAVSRGQVIGKMGSTGRSTGTHLHFEIRRNGEAEDPLGFLK